MDLYVLQCMFKFFLEFLGRFGKLFLWRKTSCGKKECILCIVGASVEDMKEELYASRLLDQQVV